MKNPLLLTVFVFIVCLISVGLIILLEYFFDNMFFAVLIEGILVFFACLFLLRISQESYFAVVFIYSICFILLETGIYALCEALGFIDVGMKDLISWRLLYSSGFSILWIFFSCFGLKYKDKMLWILWLFIGFCIHGIGNLIFQVVS